MKKSFIVFLLNFMLFWGATQTYAMRIEITEGQVAPTPIAVPDMIQGTPLAQEAQNIVQVIRNDLENCGLFRLIDPRSFLNHVTSLEQMPRFQDWRVLDARCLCISEVKELSNGALSVSFKLYDTVTGQLMSQETLSMRAQKWRKLAHRVADAIYKRITGETGYFDSQIVYVHEQ
jgi:TolB protein